jgi:hypothetical protein
VTEILEHATIKVLGVVDCDLLQNSIGTSNVLPEKFCIVVEDTLVIGFASTHLVKYSTSTTVKV